jgi:hypothetical protein
MKKLIFIVLFFMLFIFSCSTTDAPFEHRYVVSLVLKPDMKFQRAYVDSTYRLDAYIDSNVTGISGAEIFIVDNNSDTFRYSESDTLTGLYFSSDSFCVKYGMKYFVNVIVNGEEISREVQVPGSLTICAPQHLDTISLSDPPILIWNTCEKCFDNTYMIASYIEEDTLMFIPMLTPDTTMGIFYNRFLFEEKDTNYTVLVEAMDSNFFSYLKSSSIYEKLGDNNAIGLIGAMVFDTIRVWVQE